MSRTIGMDAIRCRPTPRPAHVEYSMEYHGALISQVAELDSGPGANSETAADNALRPCEVLRRFYDAWDYDFLWGTHDGFVNWAKAGLSQPSLYRRVLQDGHLGGNSGAHARDVRTHVCRRQPYSGQCLG